MPSQVLNGSSNPSYTNTTGQNVRVRLNYISNPTAVSWGNGGSTGGSVTVTASTPAPKEVMLAPTETFTANSGAFNIVIIKEDGT